MALWNHVNNLRPKKQISLELANFHVLSQFFGMDEHPKVFYLDSWFIDTYLARLSRYPSHELYSEDEFQRFRDTYQLIPKTPCTVFFFARERVSEDTENISGVIFDYCTHKCFMIGRVHASGYVPQKGSWAPLAGLWSAIANDLFRWGTIHSSERLEVWNANWGLVSSLRRAPAL